MPSEASGRYYLCRRRGIAMWRPSAPSAAGTPAAAAWGTHVWVDSADEATARVREAGGSVLAEPFDLLDAARVAVLADPEGAVLCRGSRKITGERSW